MGRTLLIRHASTKANSSEVVRSTNDIPIDDKGTEEAMATGRELHDIPIHTILTSDMKRAFSTAKIIASLNKEKPMIEQSVKLNPIDWGSFVDRKVKEVQPLLNYYLRNPKKQIPGGGTVQKTVDNARNVILPLVDKNSPENIAIVLHNSHFRALPHILDKKKSLVKNDDIVPPGGVIELIKNSSGEVRMVKL